MVFAKSLDEPVGRAPAIREISTADLRDAVARGIDDFLALPTFAAFIVVIYPAVALLLMRLTFGYELLPLIFPLFAGFPLLGPFAAVGLYELSRRRELGLPITWDAVMQDLDWPRIRAILTLGFILIALFIAWLGAAMLLYHMTFGLWAPPSIGDLVREVFTTRAGAVLLVVGCGVGFLFAALTFAISVVSFPLLLDRNPGAAAAMETSFRAVARNPRPMALWALIVVAALALGALPLFLGLILVLPVLGHSTWHLYRKVVEPAH